MDKDQIMKAFDSFRNGIYHNNKNRVTRSYHKGRYRRVQQIFDKNGFVVKQIIHYMY